MAEQGCGSDARQNSIRWVWLAGVELVVAALGVRAGEL
jgi:hypothetical protein